MLLPHLQPLKLPQLNVKREPRLLKKVKLHNQIGLGWRRKVAKFRSRIILAEQEKRRNLLTPSPNRCVCDCSVDTISTFGQVTIDSALRQLLDEDLSKELSQIQPTVGACYQ